MARAIKKLHILGGGFAVIPVGGRRLVQSVPGELNMDHTAVLQKAEVCTTTIVRSYLSNPLPCHLYSLKFCCALTGKQHHHFSYPNTGWFHCTGNVPLVSFPGHIYREKFVTCMRTRLMSFLP